MKTIVEEVIVKDYGRQGLAVFDPKDRANIGSICGWTTVLTRERGYKPDNTEPMSYGECSMGYFLDGQRVSSADPRLPAFLERYRRYAESCYIEQPIKLVLKQVYKDQQRYRDERWKR